MSVADQPRVTDGRGVEHYCAEEWVGYPMWICAVCIVPWPCPTINESPAGSGSAEFSWDWLTDESLPHRGEYVVKQGDQVIARCGSLKANYETARRMADALNAGAPAGSGAENQ